MMVSSEATARVGTDFGRKVVGFAFVLAVFGWGIGFYGPSVFLHTLHQERGWSITLISLAITAHFLFSALFVTYLPKAYGRWGIARVTQAGVACTAIGAILWSNAFAPSIVSDCRRERCGFGGNDRRGHQRDRRAVV